jgi:hypothetical protein
MSQSSAITTSPDPKPGPQLPLETPNTLADHHRTVWHQARRFLTPLASLRVTVVLFALSILLVFFGTLAQVDQGIFTVLKNYFRCAVAWVPWQVFVRFGQTFLFIPQDANVPGHFPFPGGWLLGGLLLANLLSAHLVRFKLSWKRSGILILHAGLVVMMLSELITGLFAGEARMTIDEGVSTNYTEDYHAFELAVIDRSDPLNDNVVVIPGSFLQRKGIIGNEKLPFDVVVDRYMVNSAVENAAAAPAGFKNPANAGDGLGMIALEQKEVSGTKSEIDIPAAYITLRAKGKDQSLGTYLVTPWFPTQKTPGQQVDVDGKPYYIAMRFKRTYKPFSLHLIKFSFDRYPGTETARNFSSLVRLVDTERGENREVLIRMNEPLRYRGDAFYQSDFDKKTEKTTVLQIVRNPGWLMPYISCGMVALGMLLHFGLHLEAFLRRRFLTNV